MSDSGRSGGHQRSLLVVGTEDPLRRVVERGLRALGLPFVAVDACARDDDAAVVAASLVVAVIPADHPDPPATVAGLRAATDRPIVVIGEDPASTWPTLGSGADDALLAPPLDEGELGARISARLGPPARRLGPVLRHGALAVDRRRREVHLAGRLVELTRMEFDLLAHLAAHPYRVFTRDELLRAVWGSSSEWQQDRTVNEHVRRLRAKLGEGWVATVRRVGYRFEPGAHAPT